MTRSSRKGRPTIDGSFPIPTRAVVAVAGTVLGLALLLSFRTPDDIPATAGGRLPEVPSSGPAAVANPVAPAGASGRRIAPATPIPTSAAAGTPRNPTPTRAAPTSPAPVAASPTAAGSVAASGDVKGPIEQTPFGDVQVEVKVASGRIVDVVAVQLPYDRRRSAQISAYVEPILHNEALQAQSSKIDLISGATWTSGAYQASLEGALATLANG